MKTYKQIETSVDDLIALLCPPCNCNFLNYACKDEMRKYSVIHVFTKNYVVGKTDLLQNAANFQTSVH